VMGNVGTWWAPDLIVAETPWRHELKQGGGISLDLGPHFFDMIRYIGGGEIKTVSAQTQVVEPIRYLVREGKKTSPINCEADDSFFANFRNKKGACGTLFGSWAGRGSPTTVAEGPVFYGSNGRVTGDEIHIDGESKPECLSERYTKEAPTQLQEKHFPMGLTNNFALASYDWLRAIETGKQPECTGREGLMDLACAYAVVESSLAQREVTIDEIVSGTLRDYQRPIDQHYGLD